MRNNSNKNTKKTSARTPAARQGAAKPASLAERREKAVIRLPEERRKGTKYQIIRGQYLSQANKKENVDKAGAASIKKAAAAHEEKQEKAKRQTMAAKSVNGQKEQNRIISSKAVSHESTETTDINKIKDEYVKIEKISDYTERLEKNASYESSEARFAKAAEYTERLQANIELSNAVGIPPAVTWDQTLDRSVQKDSVYKQGGTAEERAASYKEKANFYLDKMKKNAETVQKEVNPNSDKDIGELYKKAYKLAHKEELLGKNNSSLFDKAQSAIQLKSEVYNAVNKDNTGEAVLAAAAIPIIHATTKAVRKLADKNRVVNAGKTGFELTAKVTAEVAASDSAGEAAVNAIAAVPKYAVEKKVEKTVRQVMQNQHDRKIEAQKERLRKSQEKTEKRAQAMEKENMQRKMKADLYKSEHGITSSGNSLLKNSNAAIKNTIEAMKRAITAIKSLGTLLVAASGGTLITVLFGGIIIIIILLLVVFPFFYTSEDGTEGTIEDSEFVNTILHYYSVMDTVVDDFNRDVIEKLLGSVGQYNNTGVENPAKKAQYDSDYAEYQTQYDSYMADYDNYCMEYPENYGSTPEAPEQDYWYSYDELSSLGMERGPIFEGFVWSDETDAERVPKGNLYDEMLCTISTYNTKLMTRPDTVTSVSESSSNSGDIIFMNDRTVSATYNGAGFWDFTSWEESVSCPSNGSCCSKTVTVTHYDEKGNITEITIEEVDYCPGHYVIMLKLKLDFDLNKIWDSYNFDGEDEEIYEEAKKAFDKEKENAEII